MNSLRTQLINEISRKCPKLLIKDKILIDYLADKNWALLVFPFYIGLYSLSFLPFPNRINFITIEKAQELNNSSNGILASIVGITMVIIGFIFTEIKSKSFVNFKFFSERTFIFPIFYSSLANIAGMLFISLMSSTLDINNAVILSHYLIILVNIPLIIIVFKRVAKYMDYQPVFDSYKKMVLKKANSILFEEKIVELFSNRIIEIFKKNDIHTPYSLSAMFDTQKVILRSKNPIGILHDIYIEDFEQNINSIRKSNSAEVFQYAPFLIGKNISENAIILYAKESSDITPISVKSFKVKTLIKDDNETTYKAYLENIHQQYLDAVRNNNTNLAIDSLSMYKELFDLYCETDKDLR